MVYTGGTKPNFDDWRICSSIAIWEAAYILEGHDPRVSDTDLLLGECGEIPDYSHQHRALISSTSTGEIVLAPGSLGGAVDEKSKITMRSFIAWLHQHGKTEIAVALSPPPPKGQKIKRDVLISRHEKNWSSIVTDLSHARDLIESAKAPEHGYWYEAAALNWAASNNRLKNTACICDVLAAWVAP